MRGKSFPGEVPKNTPHKAGLYWCDRREYFAAVPLMPTASGRTAAQCAASPPLVKYQKNTPHKAGLYWCDRREYFAAVPLMPTASGRTAAQCAASPSLVKYQKTPRIKRGIFWYSRRESNPQRPLRRGLLYPFNYGSISYFVWCHGQ